MAQMLNQARVATKLVLSIAPTHARHPEADRDGLSIVAQQNARSGVSLHPTAVIPRRIGSAEGTLMRSTDHAKERASSSTPTIRPHAAGAALTQSTIIMRRSAV